MLFTLRHIKVIYSGLCTRLLNHYYTLSTSWCILVSESCTVIGDVMSQFQWLLRPIFLIGAPSATALLQHGIQFLLPLKIVPPYTVLGTTSSLTS